ncbi:ParB/RepB/Spo0J family partition protein [Azohydromonas caseinilytica]|uniref:ParB/RepB/Spo0J family partition protein n=1 Tax=Azohydromonas caseinilytica TaxID=2728836 RepID=A0A848FBW1_9BURK|nr:ParB/RepB/Spo0J family partition protein [Azohydromonas caseinilytica]NML15680.1 ParB/RepB/Spo0J family partition protein [Azohydromonas caseinilytica]
MSKKLAAKAGLIQVPPASSSAAAAVDEARAKTAPGSMLQFLSTQSAAIKEAEDLRERLREFEGAAPVRGLDAAMIRPSRWANRHEASFNDAEFRELKAEIEAAGGNVQPVKVRPLSPAEAVDVPGLRYELVFGHRRHRACLELGLPVRALIEEVSDQQLFEAMERENRGRKNLSPWEQGCMYRRALDEGLYPSLRKLAEAVQVDVSLVSKSLALARLPAAVVEAFASPLEIQFRWAQPLSELLQKDPDAVLERARELKAQGRALAAQAVFNALTGQTAPAPAAGSAHLRRDGRKLATLSRDARGRASLRFEAGVLPPEREAELLQLVEDFIRRQPA